MCVQFVCVIIGDQSRMYVLVYLYLQLVNNLPTACSTQIRTGHPFESLVFTIHRCQHVGSEMARFNNTFLQDIKGYSFERRTKNLISLDRKIKSLNSTDSFYGPDQSTEKGQVEQLFIILYPFMYHSLTTSLIQRQHLITTKNKCIFYSQNGYLYICGLCASITNTNQYILNLNYMTHSLLKKIYNLLSIKTLNHNFTYAFFKFYNYLNIV